MSSESLQPHTVSCTSRKPSRARKLWYSCKRLAGERVKAETLFKIALAGSIGIHALGFAYRAAADSTEERVVKIPVMLEAQEPPPVVEEPPPPPPEPEPKPRPASVPQHVEEVVEGDGLRTGDLVDADVGSYDDTEPEPEEPAVEPEPEPAPPPPPPPKPEEPAVDKVKLTRQFLARVRSSLAARKTYPFSAERMGITGSVHVAFVIQPNGSFSSIRVRRSSGHGVLDRAALQTVQGLSGQLRRPPELGSIPLRTSVMLRYALHR